MLVASSSRWGEQACVIYLGPTEEKDLSFHNNLYFPWIFLSMQSNRNLFLWADLNRNLRMPQDIM